MYVPPDDVASRRRLWCLESGPPYTPWRDHHRPGIGASPRWSLVGIGIGKIDKSQY